MTRIVGLVDQADQAGPAVQAGQADQVAPADRAIPADQVDQANQTVRLTATQSPQEGHLTRAEVTPPQMARNDL